ncbi:MAG: nucleotidyl transferase AbiEii/AbiGii toxin family protein [bacterium]
MHKEVLNQKQTELLPLLKKFNKDFGLVGGTAIALQLGHRQSIDFDLFSNKPIKPSDIRRKIKGVANIDKVLINEKDEYTVIVNGVKITFLFYPFKIKFSKSLSNIIKLPDLKTLAAMKAYALGRRAKWKDYVDLYFIMKDKYGIKSVTKKAKQIFEEEFNEKIFRIQLSYFKDIDYTEKVEYTNDQKTPDSVIKKELKDISLKI